MLLFPSIVTEGKMFNPTVTISNSFAICLMDSSGCEKSGGRGSICKVEEKGEGSGAWGQKCSKGGLIGVAGRGVVSSEGGVSVTVSRF